MWSANNDLQNAIQSQDTAGEQVPFETPWRSHSIAICRHGPEKDNRTATHYCRTHRCDAPVPMHKIPQHMQTTIALQHTTVEHMALMRHFQCTSVSAHAKHNSTASTKKRKSHLVLSVTIVTLRAQFGQDSTLKWRRPKPSWARANFEPPFTRKNTMFRANPNIQIASIMAHFQCDLPTMTCKIQSESQNSTGEQVPFEKPWRSHSTAICTD